MAAMAEAGDVLDLLYDVVRKPPTAERAAGTHCLVTAALIKLVTRWGGTLGGRFQPRKKTRVRNQETYGIKVQQKVGFKQQK